MKCCGYFTSLFIVLAPIIGVGQTVAGFCNSTTGGGSSGLKGPWGIYIPPSNGILYVVDWDQQNVQSFSPFARTGVTLFTTSAAGQPVDVFVDSSNTIYITDRALHTGSVYVLRAGKNVSTFPAAGLSTVSCLYNGLYTAYGIAVDQSGYMYIAPFACCMVVKWAPNATNGTLVAGKQALYNSTSTTMGFVRLIHLDEAHGTIYVTDKTNNRIQKFILGGNGTGVTVAGNKTAGIGLNQLNDPSGIWVTRDGQTLYVADYGNNRVMKWTIGATQGSVFAGSASGIAGSTNQLLNGPADVALDPTETYLYVADYSNHRVQRFRLI